jgi:hypothetical protein
MTSASSRTLYAPILLCVMLLASVALPTNLSLARPKSHLKTATNSPFMRTSADLTIYVGATPADAIFPELYYPLIVLNKGPEIARNVSVRFPVPNGAAFNKIRVYSQKEPVRCNTPPFNGTGDIVCSLGDLSPNDHVQLDFFFDITALPGTRITAEARVESDTPDPNPMDNVLTNEVTAPPLASLDSARILTDPFRIEIIGQNLSIPQFGGSGIGIGCDCRGWSMVRRQSSTVFIIEGGKELKKLFPKGIPTRICYSDAFRGTSLIVEVTR